MKKIFSLFTVLSLLFVNPTEATVFSKSKEKKNRKEAAQRDSSNEVAASRSKKKRSQQSKSCDNGQENCLGCGKEAQYAYFYTTLPQTIAGSVFNPPVVLNSVNWSQGGKVSQDDIFLDKSDPTKIVVKKPGVYAITYTASGLGALQLALYLNGVIVPGSTFGVANQLLPTQLDNFLEVVGPIVVEIDRKKSTISLCNQDTTTLLLAPLNGTILGVVGNNVVASIQILKVAPLNFE